MTWIAETLLLGKPKAAPDRTSARAGAGIAGRDQLQRKPLSSTPLPWKQANSKTGDREYILLQAPTSAGYTFQSRRMARKPQAEETRKQVPAEPAEQRPAAHEAVHDQQQRRDGAVDDPDQRDGEGGDQ